MSHPVFESTERHYTNIEHEMTQAELDYKARAPALIVEICNYMSLLPRKAFLDMKKDLDDALEKASLGDLELIRDTLCAYFDETEATLVGNDQAWP